MLGTWPCATRAGKKDLSRLSVGKRQKLTEVDRALLASRHSTLHTRFNVLTGSRSGKAGTMKTPGQTRRDGTLTLTLIKLTYVCTYNKPNVGDARRQGLYHRTCHPLETSMSPYYQVAGPESNHQTTQTISPHSWCCRYGAGPEAGSHSGLFLIPCLSLSSRPQASSLQCMHNTGDGVVVHCSRLRQ